MTKLLDDELEEDEVFWNQEALKEVVFLFCVVSACFALKICTYFV